MDPLNPIFALAVTCSAMLAAYWTRARVVIPATGSRFSTIDGLRGYLALGVFIHHGALWHGYVRTGIYGATPSHFYNNLGKGSVTLFFMVTGLLFCSKILETSGQIDWLRMFVSRVMRLAPMYVVTVVVAVAIIAILSHFQAHVSAANMAKTVVSWLFFTVPSDPDIYGMSATRPLLGPTWTLRYEWLFYLSLPGIAAMLRRNTPIGLIALSVAAVAFATWRGPMLPALGFVGGFVATLATRSGILSKIANTPAATLVAIGCLAAAVAAFETQFSVSQTALLMVAFCLVACGNSLFGLLERATSKQVGEVTYSIYLLHSIVLFILFEEVVGTSRAATLSAEQHWGLVILASPVLFVLSLVCFNLIEAPAMERVSHVAARIRERFGRPAHPSSI